MHPDLPAHAPLRLEGLSKHFGALRALTDLNLEVRRGEIFGFLGLNGAGKTTTLRIILDLLKPSAGRAWVFGHDCQSRGLKVRSAVGFLPAELGFYGDMTGAEVLRLLGRLDARLPRSGYRAELMDRFGLREGDLKRRLREYSTGMRRKLGLVQALQGEPPLLVLDEPTEGLDPLIQESFYDLAFDLKRRGCTLFMSSHVLSEVERVCDRIGLLRDGRLILLSTVEEIRQMAPRRVRVFFDTTAEPVLRELPPGHTLLDSAAGVWTIRVPGSLSHLLLWLEGFPVKDLRVEEPKLEEVLMQYYRQERH